MNRSSSNSVESAHRLRRRVFLSALGLGVAVPLATKLARVALAQPSGRPSRLFIYFVPHGFPVEHTEVDGNLDFDSVGVGVFGPLAPYKDQITVIRGASNVVTSDHPSMRVSLSGTEGSPSVDFLVADALNTIPHVLGAQPHRKNSAPDADARLFNHGGWVTPITNPADALDDLLGGASPAPVDPGMPSLETDFRTETLALSERQVERLRTEVLGHCSEESKLTTHLQSLAAQKSAATSGGGFEGAACDDGGAQVGTAAGMAGADGFDDARFADVVDGHLEVAAQALLCGQAQVVGMQNLYANSDMLMDFPRGPGVADKHHDPISHSDKTDTAGREAYAQCQRWFIDRFAQKFVEVLNQADPADPEHTALENSTILVATEVNDGKTHQSHYIDQAWDVPGGPRNSYLPWLILGGGSGYFQGGRVVNVPGVDHRDVLATVADSMGVSLSQIGGYGVSPVQELKA